MDRYGEYKKSSIEKTKKSRSANKIEYPRIKKIVQSILGDHVPVSNPVQIILHGITKIHAGELIEEAKKIMYEESVENYIEDNLNFDLNASREKVNEAIDLTGNNQQPKIVGENINKMNNILQTNNNNNNFRILDGDEPVKINFDYLKKEKPMMNIKPKPLRPKHFREARRRMIMKGSIPNFKPNDPFN
jgi:hypothetical protein